jgi:serine/threonine protein kinase
LTSKACFVQDDDGELVPREVYYMQRVRHLNGVIRLLDYYDVNSSSKLILPSGSEQSSGRVSRPSYVIVMERPVHSQDLFDYITERGALSEDETRSFFRQIVETVAAMHANGVVHRDVKDENVLVDLDSKRVHLIDFGSATELKDTNYEDFDGLSCYLTCTSLEHFKKLVATIFCHSSWILLSS